MSTHGIKETKEVFKASKTVSVLVYKANAQGGTLQEKAQRIGMALIANPAALADLDAAYKDIGQVPAEVKDLQLGELLELGAYAGSLAAEAHTEIQAP